VERRACCDCFGDRCAGEGGLVYCEISCVIKRFPLESFSLSIGDHYCEATVSVSGILIVDACMLSIFSLGLCDGFDEVEEEGGNWHWMMVFLRGCGVWGLPFGFRLVSGV